MALRPCKECKQEISSSAKKCPNCGKDQRNWFMRHKILSFIGAIIILGIIGAIGSGNENSNTAAVNSSESSQKPNNEVVAKVGDIIRTDDFEITITSIDEKEKVGTEFFNSKPADGGIYLVVNWQYKNISDEPIGSFSFPSIRLVDKNKTGYNSDINASSNYATEVKLDRKILSDLNPGITVKDAEVFEISNDLYKAGGWRLMIDAEQEAYININ